MIDTHYFLYGIAVLGLVFAAVQDIRRREVANWLNFSLIAFGFAYKAIYSSNFKNWDLFIYGIFGFAIFVGLAYAFYYARVFGGGDAKLLMALGAILPYESLWSFFMIGLGFLILLFSVGAAWTLGYSVIIAVKSRRKFADRLYNKIMGGKLVFGVMALAALAFGKSIYIFVVAVLSLWAILILYFYVKAIDECMIRVVGAGELREGDWLEADVRLSNGVIKKSVHGLSIEEIARIRRAGKKVLIKEGVPFAPTFLISFLIMIFFWGTLSGFLERMAVLF